MGFGETRGLAMWELYESGNVKGQENINFKTSRWLRNSQFQKSIRWRGKLESSLEFLPDKIFSIVPSLLERLLSTDFTCFLQHK